MRSVVRVLIGLCLLFTGLPISAQEKPASPWGISSSASAQRNHAEWFPKMKNAGVSTVRMFPTWRALQQPDGTWNWEAGDRVLQNAQDNGLEINAIFMGSKPGSEKIHAFPMNDLPAWSEHVSQVVGRYGDRIRCWEVWNEGNGGFNDEKHTTKDYAKLALATYAAAKQANPQVQVGLSVASFDPAYLNQTILAMKEAGQPDGFDHLCIHPYEIAGGLTYPDGEIPFLWMSQQLRQVLKTTAPKKQNADIWITEVGHPVGVQGGRRVTDTEAAELFVKVHVLSLAEGINKVQWFEARDPYGEQAGFGLIDREGRDRQTYAALKTLTKLLGPNPEYLGWLALGQEKRGYGFLFQGAEQPVLVAWMPVGLEDSSTNLDPGLTVIDAVTGESAQLANGHRFILTNSPVLITGLGDQPLAEAKANKNKPFPWGGNYSAATTVSFQAGRSTPDGVFLVGNSERPAVTFPDGSSGIILQGDTAHPMAFYVHPSFADFHTSEYYVRVTVRRLAAGNVGMNLSYEVADSQGRGPYRNGPGWYSANESMDWQTHTWKIQGACFAKMWGYDFLIRPELSIPFALGKVEVSTKPFE